MSTVPFYGGLGSGVGIESLFDKGIYPFQLESTNNRWQPPVEKDCMQLNPSQDPQSAEPFAMDQYLSALLAACFFG